MFNTKRARGGFTLLESLVASSILAVAVVGIVGPLTASSQQTDVMMQNSAALSLAGQLMSEIASRAYTESNGTMSTGPLSTQTRRGLYDSIGNYNGYSDSTSAMSSVDGTALNFGLGNEVYTRSVSAQYLQTMSGPAVSSGGGDYARVTITVTTPAGTTVQLARLFTHVTQKWQ